MEDATGEVRSPSCNPLLTFQQQQQQPQQSQQQPQQQPQTPQNSVDEPKPSTSSSAANCTALTIATSNSVGRRRGRASFLPKCRRCGTATLKGNQLMPCPSKRHTIHRLCINPKEGFPARDCECPPDVTAVKTVKATRKRRTKNAETAVVPISDSEPMSSSTPNYLSHLDATTASFFSTGMFYLQLPCPIFRSEINVALYQLQLARGVEDPTVLAVPAYLLNTQPTFATPSVWQINPPL